MSTLSKVVARPGSRRLIESSELCSPSKLPKDAVEDLAETGEGEADELSVIEPAGSTESPRELHDVEEEEIN